MPGCALIIVQSNNILVYKMRSFIVVALALACVAYADEVKEIPGNTAYGYLGNIGIPEGERIRQAEEKGEATRIVGGVPAALGQYPYQVNDYP